PAALPICGFVGATLGRRALLAERVQLLFVVRIDFGLLERLRAIDRKQPFAGTAQFSDETLAFAAAPQKEADRAMHEQIRIATNRRSEMRISLVVEPEMALILCLITRLAKRAQHDGLDHAEIGPILHLCQQLLVVDGRGFVAATQIQANLAQELPQCKQALGWRALMH